MSNFNKIKKINKYSIKAWNVRHLIKEVLKDFHSQFTTPENIIAKGYKPDINLEIDCNFLANTFRGVFSPEKKKEKYKITIQISHCIDNDGNLDKNELLRTLNHEYLHYLDYKADEKYSNGAFAFSENKHQQATEIDKKIKQFQIGILSNKVYSAKNKYDIYKLDEALLKCLLVRSFNDENIVFSKTDLNSLFNNNIHDFTLLLNNLESTMFNNFNNKTESYRIKTKNEVFDFILHEKNNPNGHFNDIQNKLINQIVAIKPSISKNEISKIILNKTMGSFFAYDLINEEFNDLISSTSPFSKENMSVLQLRNLFYTQALNFYNENPNLNYLRVFYSNKNILYTGQSSEKLSFSGDIDAKTFIKDYFDLVINNNINVKMPKKIKNEGHPNEMLAVNLSNGLRKFIDKYANNENYNIIYPVKIIKKSSLKI